MPSINTSIFGGGNWSDPSAALFARAYEMGRGGFSQFAPLEAQDLRNVDFIERTLAKRKGSAERDDLTGVLVASESLIAGTYFNGIEVVVGAKSIYTKQSGSWAQINDSGSSPYTHSADVSKVSFVEGDNHLFILIDGANKIQVYRSGADMDDELDNGNTYNETFGGGTQTITGTWGTGYYIGFYLHGRLCFSNGDNVLEYTDVDQPWDRSGGGFFLASANIVAGTAFTPRGGDTDFAVGLLSTTVGAEWVPGFDLTDTPQLEKGTRTAINHRVLVPIQNWVVYMTDDGGFEGVSLGGFIDLGRRLRALDGVTGPMDTFSASNSNHGTEPFGVYHRPKRQAMFFYPDGSEADNGDAIVIDFYLGEPTRRETQVEFERHVRLLHWTIKDSGNNPWFIGAYDVDGDVVGITAAGKTWNTEDTGYADLGSIAILDLWRWPDFDGSAPDNIKNWRRSAAEFASAGNWSVAKRDYLDRASGESGAVVQWLQVNDDVAVYDTAQYDSAVYASGGTVRRVDWVEKWSHLVGFDLRNERAGENWILRNFSLRYDIGSMQD